MHIRHVWLALPWLLTACSPGLAPLPERPQGAPTGAPASAGDEMLERLVALLDAGQVDRLTDALRALPPAQRSPRLSSFVAILAERLAAEQPNDALRLAHPYDSVAALSLLPLAAPETAARLSDALVDWMLDFPALVTTQEILRALGPGVAARLAPRLADIRTTYHLVAYYVWVFPEARAELEPLAERALALARAAIAAHLASPAQTDVTLAREPISRALTTLGALRRVRSVPAFLQQLVVDQAAPAWLRTEALGRLGPAQDEGELSFLFRIADEATPAASAPMEHFARRIMALRQLSNATFAGSVHPTWSAAELAVFGTVFDALLASEGADPRAALLLLEDAVAAGGLAVLADLVARLARPAVERIVTNDALSVVSCRLMRDAGASAAMRALLSHAAPVVRLLALRAISIGGSAQDRALTEQHLRDHAPVRIAPAEEPQSVADEAAENLRSWARPERHCPRPDK